jgi:deoxyribonuclease (pyrimidine dimer)
MTRINVVPADELTDKHLVAEYRELPRIFKLVRDRQDKGHTNVTVNREKAMPSTYTLGTGHVLFFYDKLYYLIDRYQELCNEMYHRGFTVNYPHVPEFVWDLRLHWFGEYTPTQEALQINRERIAARLRGE